MKQRDLKQLLRSEPVSERLTETQQKCIELLKKQVFEETDERTDFWAFLAGVFRFAGVRLWTVHAMILLLVCMSMLSLPSSPAILSFFMPLFALACIPSLYQGQTYEMSEIEAATRSSGAQLALAKLILAGAADLICLSIIYVFANYFNIYNFNLLQLILYTVVPLLACMFIILWYMRKCKPARMTVSIWICCGACLMLGAFGMKMSWIYEISAIGLWMVAFIVFSSFFSKELYLLVKIRKDGKMYGTIA